MKKYLPVMTMPVQLRRRDPVYTAKGLPKNVSEYIVISWPRDVNAGGFFSREIQKFLIGYLTEKFDRIMIHSVSVWEIKMMHPDPDVVRETMTMLMLLGSVETHLGTTLEFDLVD